MFIGPLWKLYSLMGVSYALNNIINNTGILVNRTYIIYGSLIFNGYKKYPITEILF